MDKIYDMKALYLYSDGYRYRIGKIVKVNEKTIRMDFGVRIDKDDFDNIHKLTDSEVGVYTGELINAITSEMRGVRDLTTDIRALKQSLNMSFLSCVNTEKLQARIDELEEQISKILPTVININNSRYQICKYNRESLESVDDKEDKNKW